MKVSLSWLKDYVPIEMEADDIADALTMAGLEVEMIADRYDYLKSVVVGCITEINPHPNADKLKVCQVDIGDRIIPVICGASNITVNMLAPLALPDTCFPDGKVLEINTIRGITSEGMLCSEAELRLGLDTSGIMRLSSQLHIGNNLAKELKLSDIVLEIDLTPNRPDCLSMIGIAREIAAIQKTCVRYPDAEVFDARNRIENFTSVTIEDLDLCPRYAARLLEDITIAPSPFWLQDRLLSVGLRPINNIVDITNFVLMETGQPLHAFDFDRLAENRIVVRRAKEGEVFTTLDLKERILNSDMLLICDGEKPVAIAGIMGGYNSEIEKSTTRVLIESAYFNPTGIRKTSKRLCLNTEASHRFERGVDPGGIIMALNRAAYLMIESGGGRLIDGIIDEYPQKICKKTIPLSVVNTNRVLGTRLTQNEIEKLLKSIDFEIEINTTDQLTVSPPSFRVDISRPVDLMEELARLSGYDNIPTTFPLIPANAGKTIRERDLRDKIKNLMIGFGFNEIISYSFINKQSLDFLQLAPNDTRRNAVNILNPLTEDQAIMRTSLLPGLLETMRHNIAQQIRNLRLFEVGKVFISSNPDNLPEETQMIAGLWTGSRVNASWLSKEINCDFYDIKGVVEGLFTALNIDDVAFTQLPSNICNYTKAGYTAQILLGNRMLGLVGEIHPQVLENYNLKQAAFVFEFNVDQCVNLVSEIKQTKAIPKFPATSRDITIIIPKTIESIEILDSVKNLKEELVENIYLFDVFEGHPIPKEKKSVSFRITYRSFQKTLEDDDINTLHKIITDKLLKEFAATLPV
ncbi:MAG: phenylalanine--tRNA ligase subunit beta [Desulfobacterales bacterium]|nr:phenylalanine--tRNA ligase subunit beta [Desulfobacterales bacterium]